LTASIFRRGLRRSRRDGGDARRRRATPALLGCIHKLAQRTGGLLRESRPFSAGIDDMRLALEVAVIQTFAERLVGLLGRRDPLSERCISARQGSPASVFSAYYGAQAAASAALCGRP
jgi:hypothetical protein